MAFWASSARKKLILEQAQQDKKLLPELAQQGKKLLPELAQQDNNWLPKLLFMRVFNFGSGSYIWLSELAH